MNFADFELLRSPPWLQTDSGGAWLASLGAEKDVQLDRYRQALLKWFPGKDPLNPTDAGDLIGDDRLLPRQTGESDATYVERLRTAWDAWALATTYTGILEALRHGGYPVGDPAGAHVIQKTQRYGWLDGSDVLHLAIHPSPNNHSPWTFDATGAEIFNQFGILFGATVAGLTLNSPAHLKLNGLVRLWKAAKANFMGTWIIISGPTWGWPVNADWGDGGRNWGGGSTLFLPPTP